MEDQHAVCSPCRRRVFERDGITNRLQKTEVTTVCNPPVATTIPNTDPAKITESNSVPDPAGNDLEDIDHFASFMRSLKAPARDETGGAVLRSSMR